MEKGLNKQKRKPATAAPPNAPKKRKYERKNKVDNTAVSKLKPKPSEKKKNPGDESRKAELKKRAQLREKEKEERTILNEKSRQQDEQQSIIAQALSMAAIPGFSGAGDGLERGDGFSKETQNLRREPNLSESEDANGEDSYSNVGTTEMEIISFVDLY